MGKHVERIRLPLRGLGQSDTVHIGDRYSNASEDAVQVQATALVAKAPLPLGESYGWHPQIQKLLDADDAREQKKRASAYPSSWDAPIFRSVFEKRGLRILNALFTCLTRCQMSASRLG